MVDHRRILLQSIRHFSPFILLGLGIFLTSFSCEKNTASTSEDLEQQIFFELEYINFAWGAQLNGCYMDGSGNVFCYDYSNLAPNQSFWQPNDSGLYTLEELTQKYQPAKTLLRKVPISKLTEKARLIAGASEGQFSPIHAVGADFGKQSLLCYVYNPDTERYRRILITVRGDFEYDNLSPEAEELRIWLNGLLMRPDFR